MGLFWLILRKRIWNRFWSFCSYFFYDDDDVGVYCGGLLGEDFRKQPCRIRN